MDEQFEMWWTANDVEYCSRLTACELAFTAGRAAQLEVDVTACKDEYVDAADTKHESDIAYNNAVDDCIAAIRRGQATTDDQAPSSSVQA